MSDEKLRILELVSEGKVSPLEGVSLLDAVSEDWPDGETRQNPQMIRILVRDLGQDKTKISMNLPLGVIDWALRTGCKFAKVSGIDLEGLMEGINKGLRGTLVDVTDQETNQRVEIFVE